MSIIADVAVENAASAFDNIYSYRVPATLEGRCLPGCRVGVSFGRSRGLRTAVVLSLRDGDPAKLKPVASLLDAEPLLDAQGLSLLAFIREQTFCTWFDALRLLIPAGIGMKHRIVYTAAESCPPVSLFARQLYDALLAAGPTTADKLVETLDTAQDSPHLAELVESGAVLATHESSRKIKDERVIMLRVLTTEGLFTEKQQRLLDIVRERDGLSLKEACYLAAVTRSVADTLRKNGVLEYSELVVPRDPYANRLNTSEPAPGLTPEQQTAYEQLQGLAATGGTALLHGVTGSGKTEVYLSLIEHVTSLGRSAIVLVPEISLTAQTLQKFHSRFGKRVAVLHSGLSQGERLDEWQRIKSGGADIVVGTRSAVFAPLANIGLIVIDEEQEHTYKSEKTPRYHARDIAAHRCRDGGLLLLASATPSVESYHSAREGRFTLIELPERYGGNDLAEVFVVDMSDAQNLSPHPSLSQRLLEEMHYNLEHGEQTVLLLNRRGYSTVVKCSSCGAAAECPHCSVAMTFHIASGAVHCHYCGHVQHKIERCPSCESNMVRYSGAGTQRLEEEIAAIFPDARILRVDMDTTMTRFSHEKLFRSYSAHEYDIMIGTQMIAKGHNFPKVTLAGVISADHSLFSGDFRSYEKSFALLTQIVGRSGRSMPGRAIVQTYSPEHHIIAQAAKQDYKGFFRDEIESRRMHLYPPFCAMAAVGFSGEDEEQVALWAQRFLDQFSAVAKAGYPGLPVRVLGPVAADVAKAAGKYRYKLLIKCRRSPAMRALLREVYEWFTANSKAVSAFIDMHYDRI